MKRLFVTATGTEIGKTVITAQLARQLGARGHRVEALKPVASGVDPADLDASDPGVLLRALGRPVTLANLDAICPWRYEAPLAPDQAAERAGRSPVRLEEIIRFCQAPRAADVVLIEGVGGARVPIGVTTTVLDWIRGVSAAALVVSGTYLGCISHLLTTVDSLRAGDIPIAGIVLNRSVDEPMPVDETQAAIAPFVGDTPLVVFPRLVDPLSDDAPDLVGALGLL